MAFQESFQTTVISYASMVYLNNNWSIFLKLYLLELFPRVRCIFEVYAWNLKFWRFLSQICKSAYISKIWTENLFSETTFKKGLDNKTNLSFPDTKQFYLTAYTSGVPGFTPCFSGARFTPSLVLCVCIVYLCA
jgi:hypothetical protein